MSKKNVRIIVLSIIILAILAGIGFYIYDIVYNGVPFEKNLLKIVLAVLLLIASVFRLFKGNSRAKLSFYEKAYAEEIGTAFKNNPRNRKCLVAATRYYDESKYDKSLKILSLLAKEAESENDLVPVLLFMALCYTDMGLSSYAIKVYYNLLEHSPKNSRAHSNLAVQLLNEGDFNLALAHYTEAINCDNQNYYAYNNRANCYFKMQDYDNAIIDAKKALEIKNNGVEAATLLTVIYALKGDSENKEKYYHLATASGRPAQEVDYAIEHHMNSKEERI